MPRVWCPVLQITGMGFASIPGAVTLRFACPKGFVEADGRVESDNEVSFLTPSFEKFGPMQVRPSSGIVGEMHAYYKEARSEVDLALGSVLDSTYMGNAMTNMYYICHWSRLLCDMYYVLYVTDLLADRPLHQ